MGHATDPMQIASGLSFVATAIALSSSAACMTSFVDGAYVTVEPCNPALAEFGVNGTADNVELLLSRGAARRYPLWRVFETRKNLEAESKSFVLCVCVCVTALRPLVSGTNCVENTQSSANNERDCLPFIYNDRSRNIIRCLEYRERGHCLNCEIRNLDRNNKLVFFQCTIGVNVFVRRSILRIENK